MSGPLDAEQLISQVLATTHPEWVGEGVIDTETWAKRAATAVLQALELERAEAVDGVDHLYPTAPEDT